MFVVVQHTIRDAPVAFARGQNLLEGRGAPTGVQVRKFYPSADQSAVICLWEANSLDEIREYVDATLGDSSDNVYFEVDAEQALGLPEPAVASASRLKGRREGASRTGRPFRPPRRAWQAREWTGARSRSSRRNRHAALHRHRGLYVAGGKGR